MKSIKTIGLMIALLIHITGYYQIQVYAEEDIPDIEESEEEAVETVDSESENEDIFAAEASDSETDIQNADEMLNSKSAIEEEQADKTDINESKEEFEAITEETSLTELTAKEDFQFDDVKDPAAYYYEAVYWALDKGITKGTSETTFSPQKTCTRGQFLTFLWRAKGSPEPKSTKNPFSDVATTASFYKPVLWAVEKGITTGKSATKFAPYDLVTRAQAATFLYRVSGSPETKNTQIFVDVKNGLSYTNAINWAADKKITTGTDATHFSPGNSCTRGQGVTFLMRMIRDSVNLKRGWQKVDGKWKYINEKDHFVIGWANIHNSRYYFDDSGFMQTGWKTISKLKYYFNSEGQMLKGWQKINNNWYYFDDNGVMLTGWQTIGNKKYHFTEDGVMQTGWQKIYDSYWDYMHWYYFESSGEMVKGWKKLSEKWYYFNDYMYYSGWYEIGSEWYCFTDDGVMITGWGSFTYEEDGSKETIWVYCNSNGTGFTGWVKSGDDWYYADEGELMRGLNYISGTLYAFLQDGKMVKNQFYEPMTWEKYEYNSPYPYHFDSDGKGTTGWVKDANGREIYYQGGIGRYDRTS